MKISSKWLRTYFDTDLPSSEKLDELFTFHFSEVEGVEEVKDAAGKVIDSVFDLKILPDRAHYALSHRGVALEVSVLTGIPLKKNRIPAPPTPTGTRVPKVTILAPEFCKRYMACYVENINNRPESAPFDLKSYLEPIGQRCINGIVDATNMAMFDSGQPMHAFDADKVKGDIVVRAAKEGEKITLLDGREVALSATDHVIADLEGPLGIAGVKGGKRAMVTVDTKNIILESANFHPATVRKTAVKFDLRSESSKRYENEITPELTSLAMNDILALLKELSPSAQFGPILDLYPVKPTKTTLVFDPKYIANRLGIEIPEKEIQRILTAIGVENNNWTLTIPHERLDLVIPEDIVEEVGRIYGYDKIKGILPPSISKTPSVLPAFYVAEKIKNVLASVGFSEVMLYTFVPKGDVEIAKPLASDKGFARTNLSENMMSCLERNALNADLLGLSAIKTFEIGKVFTTKGEFLKLSIGVAQVKKVKGKKAEDVVKEAIVLLEKELGISIPLETISSAIFAVVETDLDAFIPKVSIPANYADLNFTKTSAVRYKPFSVYPFIVRDIALFVPDTVSEKEVWDEIEKGIKDEDAMDWLARHELFDVFKKDGKTSYAFRMVFQSMEQTLTDFEVNDIMEKIYFRMKEKNWQVR